MPVRSPFPAPLGIAVCDNGAEFTSRVMDLWAGVQIDFPRLGKPTDNTHVESFNGDTAI